MKFSTLHYNCSIKGPPGTLTLQEFHPGLQVLENLAQDPRSNLSIRGSSLPARNLLPPPSFDINYSQTAGPIIEWKVVQLNLTRCKTGSFFPESAVVDSTLLTSPAQRTGERRAHSSFARKMTIVAVVEL